MTATSRLFLAATLAAVAWVRPAAQQQRPADEGPQVTFKVEVNYVEVDAAVFDRQGAFVSNLRRDDFEVFEDGVKQDVTAFTQVNIPIERAEPMPIQAKVPVEADVVTNARPFDGRVYVIVLDDKHTAAFRTSRTRKAAEQFITRYMADNDIAAVLTTGGAGAATQDFTSNKRLLLAAVNGFIGAKLRSETEERLDEYRRQQGIPSEAGLTRVDDPSDMQRGFDARIALDNLARISDWVGSIRGRRKAIVFFSEGIDYNIYDFNKREATTVQEGMRAVFAAATRSNVSIYSIDPRGLTGLGEETIEVSGGFPENPQLNLSLQSFNDSLRLAQDSLRSLSEETGGFAAVNRNDYNDAFSRVVKDNSAYYVLGYYPKNDRRDGRFRKIEVKVSRPGFEVRSRRGYTAPRGKAPAPPKAAVNEQASPQVREALESPLPLPGLTLRAFAAPFKGTDKNTAVSVTIEAEGSDFGFAQKDGRLVTDLELVTTAVDVSGKNRGGDRSVVNLALRPENRDRFVQTGVRVATRLQLPPGKYQLRVAARESGGGRVGSINYDLDVPDFSKEPLGVSGVAIASAAALSISTAKVDDQFKEVLPGPPTAIRVFPRGDTLAIFAEVYDNDVKAPHIVDITTTVVSEDGRNVFKTAEERSSADLQGKPGGYGHQARIELKDFAPGIYLLTVEARSRAGNNKPVGRTVQFRVQ
jgi:VWFA-related protein